MSKKHQLSAVRFDGRGQIETDDFRPFRGSSPGFAFTHCRLASLVPFRSADSFESRRFSGREKPHAFAWRMYQRMKIHNCPLKISSISSESCTFTHSCFPKIRIWVSSVLEFDSDAYSLNSPKVFELWSLNVRFQVRTSEIRCFFLPSPIISSGKFPFKSFELSH